MCQGLVPWQSSSRACRKLWIKTDEPNPGRFGGFTHNIGYLNFLDAQNPAGFPGWVQEGGRSRTEGGAGWNSSMELLGRTLSCGAARLCPGGTKADCSAGGSLAREAREGDKDFECAVLVLLPATCPPRGLAGEAPAGRVLFPFWKPGKGGRMSEGQRICVGGEPRHLNSLPGLWGMHFCPVHHRPGVFPLLKPVRSPPAAVLFSFPAPLSSFIQPIHCK